MWNNIYTCECGHELLAVQFNKEDKNIYLAFFKYGVKRKSSFSFMDRVKYCWEILRRGTLYNDMLILDREAALDLGTELLKFCNSADTNGKENV